MTCNRSRGLLERRDAGGGRRSLHRLSVCNGPENYSLSGYENKEPLLIVSPDGHVRKGEVLQQIAQACPNLRIQVIENLHYEDYMRLVRRAKWSLTFGEGLDGYFAEPVWSGGVAFAVFNDHFFTPAFAGLETIYPSWAALMQRMPLDLQRFDEPVAYNRCWRQACDLLSDLTALIGFVKTHVLSRRIYFPVNPAAKRPASKRASSFTRKSAAVLLEKRFCNQYPSRPVDVGM